MIDEVKKSVSQILSDRASSPVFGTFFLSWATINWRVVLVAFSGPVDVRDKISLIESLLDVKHGFILPSISCLVLVLLYPWISLLGTFVWEKAKAINISMKQSIENKILLTREQSLAIRLEMQTVEEKYKDIAQDRKSFEEKYLQQIEEKRNENITLAQKVDQLQKHISNIERNNRIKSAEMKILNDLYENGEIEVPILEIAKRIKIDENDILVHIDTLMELHMVNRSGNSLRISSAGRKYVFDQKNSNYK